MAKTIKQTVADIQTALQAGLKELGIRTEADVQKDVRNAPVANALDSSISTREDVGFIELPENELLNEAADVALQLMSGEVPEDVKATIEQFNAEITQQGGLGLSQAASNVTARDLGLTSMNLIQTGSDLSTKIGDIRERSAQFNQNSRLKWEELDFAKTKWMEQYSLGVGELDLNKDQHRLATYELISRNHNAAQSLINDLIIYNARDEIEGVQQNEEALWKSLTGLNKDIASTFGLL